MRLSRKTKMTLSTEIFQITLMSRNRICLVALAQRKINNRGNINKTQNIDYKLNLKRSLSQKSLYGRHKKM